MPAHDIVVLGAGPSGAAAAAELARRGFRTTLVGRTDPRPNVGECLPPGIRPQLEKAGVWETFLRSGHTPSVGIRAAWGSPDPSDRDFVLSPYGSGWHIDRASFDATMRDSALKSGADWIVCHAVRNVRQTLSGWRIDLATDSAQCQIEGRLIIDATGRSSVFASRIGVKRRFLDRLMGVAGYYSAGENVPTLESMLLVEAVENGWWYSAPLPEGKLIAVFLTDADHVQREAITRADRWTSCLRATLHQKQRIEKHGGTLAAGIFSLPAESSFLEQVAGDGWLATGDAAAAFDPLSSQGIMSAISSGLDAAHTAAASLMGNRQAAASYANRIRKKYSEYLAHREIYYRMERRWPNSSFWKSRHAMPQALSASIAAHGKVAVAL